MNWIKIFSWTLKLDLKDNWKLSNSIFMYLKKISPCKLHLHSLLKAMKLISFYFLLSKFLIQTIISIHARFEMRFNTPNAIIQIRFLYSILIFNSYIRFFINFQTKSKSKTTICNQIRLIKRMTYFAMCRSLRFVNA